MWRFYLPLAFSLAKSTCSRVFLPDYRLAPEHPFPSALEDCEEAYEFAQSQSTNLILIGDSAGGNLALNIAQSRTGNTRGLALLSPWLDLTHTSNSFFNHNKDTVVFPESARRAAWLYVMGSEDWSFGANDPTKEKLFQERIRNPQVSPIRGHMHFAESNPVLIQVGRDERLFGDSLEAFSLIQTGTDKVTIGSFEQTCEVSWNFISGHHKLSVWRDVPHVWQITRPWTNPAKLAVRELVAFCNTSFRP